MARSMCEDKKNTYFILNQVFALHMGDTYPPAPSPHPGVLAYLTSPSFEQPDLHKNSLIIHALICIIHSGYKYELALVLNGTVAIPNLDSLELQFFQSFRKSTMPLTPSSSALHTPNATPSSVHTQGTPPTWMQPATPSSSLTPRSQRKQTKDHFNYLLLDPVILDKLNTSSVSSGMQA